MLQQERVTVLQNQSEQTKLGQLIISVRGRTGDEIEFVVGCPGLPNVHKEFFRVGDSVLFETPDDGIIEVRVMAVGVTIGARFLISQVSPRTGIAGGFVDQDPSNAPFTPSELEQIASSLTQMRQEISLWQNVTSEQLDLISRKLDEMQSAAQRLGRKDWMTYVAGTLTGIMVNAAVDREVGKAIFEVAGTAFSWRSSNDFLITRITAAK